MQNTFRPAQRQAGNGESRPQFASVVVMSCEAESGLAIEKDDEISNACCASDMADALIRSFGWSGAWNKAHAHVLRCVEAGHRDSAQFWMNVRNIVDHLTTLGPQDRDLIH